MKILYYRHSFVSKFLGAVLLTLAGIVAGRAQPILVYDSISSATAINSLSSIRTFVGEAFNLGNVAGGSNISITNMTTYLVSYTTASYTDIVMNVQFWQTASGTTSGLTPAFSNPIGNVITFDLGAASLAASIAYTVSENLTIPVVLTSSTNLGITISYEGNTGSGLALTSNLSPGVTTGAGFAVGSPIFGGPKYGFYRNGSGETDGNFPGSDFHTISSGNYASLALQLYGTTVPEPADTAAVVALAAGGCGLLARQARRKQARATQ